MFGGSRDQAEASGNIYRGICILPAWILLLKKKKKRVKKKKKVQKTSVMSKFLYIMRGALIMFDNF